MDPTGRDGEVIDFQHGQYKNLTRPVTVTIGGRVAQVISSRLIYTGEIQVSAYVPVDAPAGDAELPLSVGTATSRTGVTVSVK